MEQSGLGQRLPAQQSLHAGENLPQGAQRRFLLQSELSHPFGCAMPDSYAKSAWVSTCERRDLHRRHCRVAHQSGHDTDADGDTFGRLERGGRRGKAAVVEVILMYPQLIETALLGELIGID